MLGYAVAYAMVHAGGRTLRWLPFFVLFPLWISVLVRAFAWVTLLRSNGLVNQGLLNLGLITEPLALVRNELGVTIGMVHYMIPFAVLPLYSSMRASIGASSPRRAGSAPGRCRRSCACSCR